MYYGSKRRPLHSHQNNVFYKLCDQEKKISLLLISSVSQGSVPIKKSGLVIDKRWVKDSFFLDIMLCHNQQNLHEVGG